jgi:hypothetical protein
LQVQRWRQWKGKELGRALDSQHFRGKVTCWSSNMGLGGMTSGSIIHMDLHKPKNKLVSA